MALGSTQPLVKMSTRNIPGSKGGRCMRLTTYHHIVPFSRNLRALTLLDPSGPAWPVTGVLYLFSTSFWCILGRRHKKAQHKYIGCPNKSARFNFAVKPTIYSKSADILFQYKVHTLRLTVEHNIRQTSPHDSAGTLLFF